MKCPCCHRTAATFSSWGNGVNAFRTRCDECGKALRSTNTWLAVLGGVVGMGAVFTLGSFLYQTGTGSESQRDALVVGGLLTSAFLTLMLGWFFGGYQQNSDDSDFEERSKRRISAEGLQTGGKIAMGIPAGIRYGMPNQIPNMEIDTPPHPARTHHRIDRCHRRRLPRPTAGKRA
ncbi:MAG: hypothetical protein R3F11_16050 [Verrucomicrobiales bacterium]